MTIRLLSTYDGFAPNSIITIDPALEAAFIAAGNATADLTGGVVAYRERQPVMIQPATKKRGSVSLIANRKATVPLTEGSALTITPTAGTTGTYQRYDASGAAVGSLTAIGATVLTAGAFEGDFTVEIKCTTGSLAAKVVDAVLTIFPAVQVWYASGDATGITDDTTINAAILSASLTSGRVYVKKGNYITAGGIAHRSNVHVEFEPGTVIKAREKSVASSTLFSGNATIQVSSVQGLVVGMQVSDPDANLSAGDAFGAIPYGTLIQSINAEAGTVTLTIAPTASKTVNLNFHPRINVWTVNTCVNWSLRCPGGWVTLDSNAPSCYPYAVNSDDARRNAVQLVDSQDGLIDGVSGENAFYHGLIAVQRMRNIKVIRWRGRDNGYRCIHFHGEAAGGDPTPELRDNYFDYIEDQGSGLKSFYALAGSEYNSGVFVVFDYALNTQIKTVRSRGARGAAFMANGGNGAFVDPYSSRFVQIDSIIAEDCGTGVQVSQMDNVQFNQIVVRGKKLTLAACVFPATASVSDYSVRENGVINTVKVRTIDIPIGAIAANGIREGYRVFASGGTITGFPSRGLVVWKYSVGTGAGGKDQLTVFDYDNPANDPWTGSGTTALLLRSCTHAAFFLPAAVNTKTRNISVGSLLVENGGRFGIDTTYSNVQYRFFNINFGECVIIGATSLGVQLSSIKGIRFGSLSTRNCSSGLDAATVSGSYENYAQNCADVEINNFKTEMDTGIFTNNNEGIRFDSACRSSRVQATSLRKPAAGFTVNIQTPSGAAANAAGTAGPVILENPTASDGTPLTVAGGQISRVDATACIITRPVDAP